MNFRRWITALAVLTLFVGLAAAQTGTGGTAMTCNTVAQVTPTIRAEGITELVGDIVITCTGGSYIPPDVAAPSTTSVIPQANIFVSLTAPVTSRVLSTAPTQSEALLLVDEPNSGLAAPVSQFGPEAQLKVCTTPLSGCVAYARSTTRQDNGQPIVVAAANDTGAPTTAANVFQGLSTVGGNQVQFLGVPILAPVTTGISRVYRITNIRVNASGAGGSVVSGVSPVYAYISTNGSTSLAISNAAVTVAFVQTSLTPTVDRASGSFTQCNLNMGDIKAQTVNAGNVAILNFTEAFPSAFKTRTNPAATPGGSSYLGTSAAGSYTQNQPGKIYNSESGFILPVNSLPAGLASSGTRLKAVFANLPAGATVYVSRSNVTNGNRPYLNQFDMTGNVIGGVNAVQPNYALLTTGGESGTFTAPANASVISSAYSLTTCTTLNCGQTTAPNVDVVALNPTNGAATAVWEVVNTNTSANETFKFAVYIAYTPNLTAGTPTITPSTGGPTVTLSYAPIGAQNDTWIPRFIVGAASTPQSIITIVPCQTLLLFPFVSAASGYNTGIAISNTSKDPLAGSQSSDGVCRLYFYGAQYKNGAFAPYSQPTTPIQIGPIKAGNPDPLAATYNLGDPNNLPGFQGYMFALCDFQQAHGFAFISDTTGLQIAEGYLALVVNNGNTVSRAGTAPAAESLGQ